jgi:hypothetical protein
VIRPRPRPSISAAALAVLYLRRWGVELDFRHLKATMGMDALSCETVAGVQEELAMYALAHDLVRSRMADSARARGVPPDRVGSVDAVRWLIEPGEAADPSVLLLNPRRLGGVEPRVVKRRPKQ